MSHSLVTESRAGDEPSTVVRCNVPAGVAQTPNRTGEGDGMAYPNPADALGAFLKGQPSLPSRGYLEVRLPDGTLVYGAPARDGRFVAVVQVVPSLAGWRVSRWEASGC